MRPPRPVRVRENLRRGKHPPVNPIIPPGALWVHSHRVKTNQMEKALTFGDLIATVYNACGKRRARGILRLCLQARLVAFRGCNRYVLSKGNGKA